MRWMYWILLLLSSCGTKPSNLHDQQTGLLNAMAKLETQVEAIGLQINSNTYESWSLKAAVAGMLFLLWMVIRQKTKHSLADTALDRVIQHLEVYRDREGVDQIIEHLRKKDDDVEKYLHQRVKKAT